MALLDLTSHDAVLRAVAEFDALGRDAFLAKYGFRRARGYFLLRDGRSYDSKAIAGAAHGTSIPNWVHSPRRIQWRQCDRARSPRGARIHGGRHRADHGACAPVAVVR